MGLPGHRRTSSHKRRRAAHFALETTAFNACPKCKKPYPPSKALLEHIAIPRKNIFAIPVSSSPEKDAITYEATVKKITGDKKYAFDLVILGMGADGHTASLFPGNEILNEKKRLVKEVFLKEKNIYRISFTFSLINSAKQILLLVKGKEKDTVLKKILASPNTNNPLPVQLLKGDITWMIA